MAKLIDLKKLLPRILKTEFWNDFSDVLTQDLKDIKDVVAQKKLLYDINYQKQLAVDTGDITPLLLIAKKFGYNIDISLSEDPDYVASIVRSLPYFIKNKNKYKIYDTYFKFAEHQGDVYNLYWNGVKLVRATSGFISNLESLRLANNLYLGFNISAERNYSSFVVGDQYLDLNLPLELDSDIIWYLDQSFNRLTTKHLAFEFFIGTYFSSDEFNLLTKNSQRYAMTSEYVNYLSNAVDQNRKLIEVPHNGCQITFIMDTTGYKDSLQEGSDYTIPNIQTNCAITTNFVLDMELFSTVKKIVVGTGSLSIPIRTSGTPLNINALQNKIAEVNFNIEELIDFNAEKWFFLQGIVNSNFIKEIIHSGETDGVKNTFSGTLLYPPIKKGSLKFTYTLNSTSQDIIDRFSNPIGFYTFYDELPLEHTDTIIKDSTGSITYNLSKENVVKNTFTLKFTINNILYEIPDSIVNDTTGEFQSDFILNSSINYAEGIINVTFAEPTDSASLIQVKYTHNEFDTKTLNAQAYADINYETGDYVLHTLFDKMTTETITTTSAQDLDYFLSGRNFGIIKPGKVTFTYVLSDGTPITLTDVPDPEDPTKGYFSGLNISTNPSFKSYIDYDSGELIVHFINPTSFIDPITTTYTYTVLNPPDEGTEITVEYSTEQNIKLTEAGLVDKDGNLVAYATFPPIEMGDSKFHTAFQWLIYKEPL